MSPVIFVVVAVYVPSQFPHANAKQHKGKVALADVSCETVRALQDFYEPWNFQLYASMEKDHALNLHPPEEPRFPHFSSQLSSCSQAAAAVTTAAVETREQEAAMETGAPGGGRMAVPTSILLVVATLSLALISALLWYLGVRVFNRRCFVFLQWHYATARAGSSRSQSSLGPECSLEICDLSLQSEKAEADFENEKCSLLARRQ